MMPSEYIRMHVRISGRVQGVGFRWFVATEARRLELAGWVRNNPDGSVELECEGPSAAVAQLRTRVQKGPPAARVDRLVDLPPGTGALRKPFGTTG